MRKEDYPYRDGYFEFLYLERGASKRTVDSYNFDLELFFGYLDEATGGARLEADQIEPADPEG